MSNADSSARHTAQGYHSLTPYVVMRDVPQAITFYRQAFGAIELLCLTDPTGRVRHAEVQIGNSLLMLVEEPPDFPVMQSPQTLGGSPVHLYLYVDDADTVTEQAVAAGATLLFPAADAGEDRRSGVTDPFGLVWWVATRREDVSRAELQRRFDANGRQTGD